MERFLAPYSGLDDPRTGNACRHDPHELLPVALCTFPRGGWSCADMADVAEEKDEFLREFLVLAGFLPSHATPWLVEGQTIVPGA
jgi:hypothetical protein